jgi:hypothetical protein
VGRHDRSEHDPDEEETGFHVCLLSARPLGRVTP